MSVENRFDPFTILPSDGQPTTAPTPPNAPTATASPLTADEHALDKLLELANREGVNRFPPKWADEKWYAGADKMTDEYRRARKEFLSALLAARRGEEDAKRLDEIEWFGCNTGDCPHSKQSECDIALLGVVRSVLAERASARFAAALSKEG